MAYQGITEGLLVAGTVIRISLSFKTFGQINTKKLFTKKSKSIMLVNHQL